MAKIGRNDLCPCGSGKKYKRCCLANDGATAREKLAAAHAAATAALAATQHDPHLCEDCNEQLDAAANAVLASSRPENSTRLSRPPTRCWLASPACMTATSVLAGSTRPKATTTRPPNAIAASSRSLATNHTSTTQSSWTTSLT